MINRFSNSNLGYTKRYYTRTYGKPQEEYDAELVEKTKEVLLNLKQDLIQKYEGNHIQLTNQNFESGALILNEPGYYELVEDIVFNPNSVEKLGTDPYSAGFVQPNQFTYNGGKYDPAAFGIGFFAAIVIYGRDIILDLNGYSITQSLEHAIHQRFYSHISLGSSPFIKGQGPHDFVTGSFKNATNVFIFNGKLCRSSHHGIHGNFAENVLIENIDSEDHEVCAFALNQPTDCWFENCHSLRHYDQLEVMGTYSNARFLIPYMESLANSGSKLSLMIQGQVKTFDRLRTAFKRGINVAFEGIVHSAEWWVGDNDDNVVIETLYEGNVLGKDINDIYKLFHNAEGLIDGNAYGFLINSKGIAVNGFPKFFRRVSVGNGVIITNCSVTDLVANVVETPCLNASQTKEGPIAPVIDPIGAILQTKNKYGDEHLTAYPLIGDDNSNVMVYTGNLLSNAQAIVAKYINVSRRMGSATMEKYFGKLSTKRSSITDNILSWISEKDSTLDSVYDEKTQIYICNGDTMFHVSKGVIAFKIDGAMHVTMVSCGADNIVNIGNIGSKLHGNYITSHPLQSLEGYNGSHTRGISLSSTRYSYLNDIELSNLKSKAGYVCGIDCIRHTKHIELENIAIGDICAAVGEECPELEEYENNPTKEPHAYGININTFANNFTKVTNVEQTGPLESISGKDVLVTSYN